MIGSDAPYYGAFLSPDAAAELWPSIDAVTAGQIPPNGRTQRVDGGYVINGRWAFGSGSTHADVIVGGCLLVDGDAPVFVDGAPDFLVACARRHLRGTCSTRGTRPGSQEVDRTTTR